MRKLATVSLAVLAATALAGSLSACSTGTTDAMSSATTKPDTTTSRSSEPSTTAKTERSGSFAGLNGKKVAGTATLTDTALMLTGFSSDEGPDLHVYLTNGTDEAAVEAGMRIDAISFDSAEQQFPLSGIDLSKYSDIVIHCDKAKAVFGAAKLA